MLAAGSIAFASGSVIFAAEIGRIHDHPLRKIGAFFKAKKIAKSFDPNKADW